MVDEGSEARGGLVYDRGPRDALRSDQVRVGNRGPGFVGGRLGALGPQMGAGLSIMASGYQALDPSDLWVVTHLRVG